MSACPEAEYRAGLSDGDFWTYALTGVRPEDSAYDDPEPPEWIDMVTIDMAPCPVCGERGACAVDAEGRVLIHAVDEDDE